MSHPASPSAALVPPRVPPSPPDSISSISGGLKSDHVRSSSNTSASFNAPCSRRSSSHSSSSDTSAASIQSLHIASVPASTLSSAFSQQNVNVTPATVTATATVSPSPPIVAHASSSPSSSSSYHSPDASPNVVAAAFRANRRDHEPGDISSESGSGDVVETGSLMRFGSSTTAQGTYTGASELEEGEIRESNMPSATMSPSATSTRQRESSQRGAISSSSEAPFVAKSDTLNAGSASDGNTPIASHTPVPSNDTASAAVTDTNSSAGLSSLPTSSTLSSIYSSSSFHTASSSTTLHTPISNSPSVNDITLCSSNSVPQGLGDSHQSMIPETGTIDLEDLRKDVSKPSSLTINTSNLNPNAAEHVPGSFNNASSVADDVPQSAGEYKTPNVYINGLPPHFPEDQLFELASPFGEIRSVRSFTRHVGEKESGYGFVLFETVDAAEKCIQSLRRFRNLHPTFSKQAHKIPGVPYTQAHSSASAGWEQEGPGTTPENLVAGASPGAYGSDTGSTKSDPNSFKSKMERLHDPNSTNLYIEGLPLSIDDASLAALVSPHRIKSSRLFQTRLSNPPRIIAFVRLETRTGAEEVIERLHGRMVRGWNDPGSRISVRFADTSEQRELRRTERSVREDDTSSPARLTIAQAALLNLRGRDQLRTQSGVTAPPIGSNRTHNPSAPTANQVYHDFSSSAHDISSLAAGGYRGSASDLTSAAALLAGVGALNIGGPRRGSAHTSPPHYNSSLPPALNSPDLTPAMAALLDSLRSNGTAWTGNDDRYRSGNGDGRSYQHSHHPSNARNYASVLGDVDINLAYPDQYQHRTGGGVAQTRGGYTPAEELILQAHAAQRRKNFNPGEYRQGGGGERADFNMGMRGYRTQASTISLPQSQQEQSSMPYSSSGGPLPAVLENDADYNAPMQSSGPPQKYPQSQLNGARHGSNAAQARTPRDRDAGKGDHQPQVAQQYSNPNTSASSQQARLSVREFNGVGNQAFNQQAHVRSTTLPPSSTPSANQHQHSRHYQHSSMSIPKSRNISTDILRTTTQELSSLHSNKHRSRNSISSTTNDSKNNNGAIYADSNDIHNDGAPYTNEVPNNNMYHRNFSTGKNGGGEQDYKKNYDRHHHHQHNIYNSTTTAPSFRDNEVYDVPQSSPPLVSPALTYSSRGSAATLSPSTPYVGSFSQSSAGGGFQGRSIEAEVGDGR